MDRFIRNDLLNWKNKKNRKPLILRGARQTGKSYSIMEFGSTAFQGKTHVINFEKHPEWHNVFTQNLDAQRILNDLEILIGRKIIPGQDLLFFDEIQECPPAIAALRYFYEQIPKLHLIAAGSLLEFALRDIPFPVGRVELLNMYPMTFAEFLLAKGNKPAYDLILQPHGEIPVYIHEMLMGELKNYSLIGGMPECVNVYIESGNIESVAEIQYDLLAAFRQDFSKYVPLVNKECLNSVLTATANNVGNKIKYSSLASGFSNATIKKAFNLLETARLITKVNAASPAGIPLMTTANEKIFKALMLDIGIMSRLCGLQPAAVYSEKDFLNVFRGALSEQFVGQEMLAATQSPLYYWNREEKNSNAETDFLFEKSNDVIPVEVKSSSYGRLKSLHLLLETFTNVENAFVFSSSPEQNTIGGKISFKPLYTAYFSAKSKTTK